MKRLLLAIAIVFVAAIVRAEDIPANMVAQPDGTYWNVNGKGENDGWIWERYKDTSCGCYGCNYTWKWRKAHLIYNVPSVRTVGFYDKFLTVLAEKESDESKQAMMLKYFPPKVSSSNGFASSTSVTTRNIGGYYQPGFAGGTTVSALAVQAGSPFADPRSVLEAMHLSDRISERAANTLNNANAMTTANANAVIETNRQAMLFEGFRQAIQAPATGEVTVTTASNTQVSSNDGTDKYRNNAVGSRAAASQLLSAVRDIGTAARQEYCAACHNPSKRSGNLDVLAMADLGRDHDEAFRRMRLPTTDKEHMPKAKPGQEAIQLSEDVIRAMEASWPRSDVQDPTAPAPMSDGPPPMPQPGIDY